MFRQDFTCPALLEAIFFSFPYRTITYYGPTFQKVPVDLKITLAWSPFARHY